MITRIIDGAVGHRFLVLAATVFVLIGGIWALRSTPLDAIPDLSDVQVIIQTDFAGQSPQVVEDQVTFPLTTAMLSVPYAVDVRGFSFFGTSFVYVLFEDGTDLYWARSRVLESLKVVSGRLPEGVNPVLGPDATGVGWIFQYALVDRTGAHDLADLRSIQDWYLRYALQTVPGVAEVASVGGYVKQYQIEVDPYALARYGISQNAVSQSILRSNRDAGGRLIEMSETEYMVRGLGRIQSLDDIKSIAIKSDGKGTPVLIKDVAHVKLGPELRRGVAELDGEGEVASGIVVMRSGENALDTLRGVRDKLEELRDGLPEGVQIVPVYDRSSLIHRAIDNLSRTLVLEFVLVALVCALFLLHVRSALVAIVALPVGILMAFIAMMFQGINANIMSLGGIAIAIGTMVDGPIVLMENAHKHLARARERWGQKLSAAVRWEAVRRSAAEVGSPVFFSLLVVVVAFFAIFTLQGQEGRLFRPLAFTSSYAMFAAALLAIVLVPVLIGLFVRGRMVPEERNPLTRLLHAVHAPLLNVALRFRKTTVLIALALLSATYFPLSKLGSEFMPPLDEGDVLYMPTTFPGISITKAKELLQQTDKILKTFPEVESVLGKVGRAETATDPAPLSMIETVARLKPKEYWPDPNKTTAELMAEMDRAIKFPGLANSWTMPIKTRIDMLTTGIKTPVGIKISGPDLNELQRLAEKIEVVVGDLPDTMSAFGDRSASGYFLDFEIDRDAIARHGLAIDDVQSVIMSSIGGMKITETIEGLERYPVNLRYPRDLRDDPEALSRVLVPTPSGAQVPIGQLAEIQERRGPPVIKTEGSRPNAWIYIEPRTSDIGGYVAEAKRVVAEQVNLPAGYTLEWSGQFEFMQRAAARLQVVIPATVLLIFVLLYMNFGNASSPALVMLSLPFALTGGFWLVYWLDFNLSVAVAVGFIALAGIAVEIGVLVVAFIREAVERQRRERVETGQPQLSRGEILDAVREGTASRLRPVAMTTFSTVIGLLPVMLLSDTGSDVMQRIAAPMVGGLLSTAALSLLVLPVVYSFGVELHEWRVRRGAVQQHESPVLID